MGSLCGCLLVPMATWLCSFWVGGDKSREDNESYGGDLQQSQSMRDQGSFTMMGLGGAGLGLGGAGLGGAPR